MTQAEKDKIIKELQEKLAEAEKIKVDEPKRWKPKCSEEYWVVDEFGTKTHFTFRNNIDDKWLYLTGNCFKTSKEAEEYKKQIEYTARYKNYIEEHSEPLDWNNEDQPKHYAEYWYDEECIKIDAYSVIRFQGVIYASSEQIIGDAIKEIGEDNFKKYVLGVK